MTNNDSFYLSLKNSYKRLQLRNTQFSLCSGTGALALLANSMWNFYEEDEWLEEIHKNLSASLAHYSLASCSTSFYSSLPGLAWLLGTINAKFPEVNYSQSLQNIGEAYHSVLIQEKAFKVDVINGLSGLAIMANRLPVELRNSILNIIWGKLSNRPEFLELIKGHTDSTLPANYDMGLAHGLPGIISSLAHCFKCGWENYEAKAAVLAAGDWLSFFCSQRANYGAIPYQYGQDGIARLGWCYGVISAAICFCWLSNFDRKYLSDVEKCLETAKQMYLSNQHGMTDMCLCHGTTSVVYCFTRIAEYLESKGQYINLDFLEPEIQNLYEVAGSENVIDIPYQLNGSPVVTDSILEGGVGILLAATGLKLPKSRLWQETMLLNFA